MPFTTGSAQSILAANVGNYIGLLYEEPSEDGSTFDEPAISTTTGYTRGVISGWDKSKSKQIANDAIIFMFECLSDLGTFTHFALFSSANGSSMKYYGELTGEVTVDKGYVPLIRKQELIIGLDKSSLESY